MAPKSLLEINNLQFYWSKLDDFLIKIDNFVINKKEKVLILGESGCGKSTLLNLIGGILLPNQGKIFIDGDIISSLSPSSMDKYRAEHIGVIFQQFYLLDFISPLNNILLPCYFTNFKKKNYNFFLNRTYELAERLNLSREILNKNNSKDISVGQRQRISILRAIINMPKIILADEPTSSLDKKNQNSFLEMLFEVCKSENISLLMVSHDERLKNKFDKTINFRNLAVQ